MSSIMTPRLGFAAHVATQDASGAAIDETITSKISRTGVEAARKKFTPEFINRLDKIVTFKPLGNEQLKRILDIELSLVQQRIFTASSNRAFVFSLSESSKMFLLEEGTDPRYGARHLRRAVERLLVQPMSNLIATNQVCGGDLVRVDFDNTTRSLRFAKQATGLSAQDLSRSLESLATGKTVALSQAA